MVEYNYGGKTNLILLERWKNKQEQKPEAVSGISCQSKDELEQAGELLVTNLKIPPGDQSVTIS